MNEYLISIAATGYGIRVSADSVEDAINIRQRSLTSKGHLAASAYYVREIGPKVRYVPVTVTAWVPESDV